MARFTEALELLDRQETDDAQERGRLLVDLGTAQFLAGMPEHRDTLLQAAAVARRLGDSDLLVAAALGGRRGDTRAGVADAQRIAVLEAALAAVGDDGASRALLLLSLAEATDAREWERRRALAEEALALASDLSDPTAALDVLLNCYLFRVQPELSAARLVESGEALTLAERLADPVLWFRACWFRVHACMEVADMVEVDLRIEQMASLAQRTGLLHCQWELLMTRAGRALLAGDLARAEALNDEALATASRIGAPEALGRVRGGAVRHPAPAGASGGAGRPRRDGGSREPGHPGAQDRARLGVLLARPPGRRQGPLCRRRVRSVCRRAPRSHVDVDDRPLAEYAVALDDVPAMEALYGVLEPHSGLVAFSVATASGALARSLGCLAHRLGRPDEAEGHFRRALEVHERLQVALRTAQTQLDFADLLPRRRSACRGAQPVCSGARDGPAVQGSGGLEQRADTLVASLG